MRELTANVEFHFEHSPSEMSGNASIDTDISSGIPWKDLDAAARYRLENNAPLTGREELAKRFQKLVEANEYDIAVAPGEPAGPLLDCHSDGMQAIWISRICQLDLQNRRSIIGSDSQTCIPLFVFNN